MRRSVYLLAAAFGACTTPPASAPAPIAALEVVAPFERTWNAVIDFFANSNIPITTMDKSSGFIVAAPLSLSQQDGKEWADCGAIMGVPFPATRVTFNVVVRPTDKGSTVRATATWAAISEGQARSCVTRGVWERGFHLRIKQAVEGAP